MPIRELVCSTGGCSNHGITYDWFARTMDRPDPKCPDCGHQMGRLVSAFATPWTGTLDRFERPDCEQHQKVGDGHRVWRVKSSRMPDGSPESQIIRTRQDQREYCKAEGLVMPDDMNPNSFISADGRHLSTVGVGPEAWGPVKPKEGNPWLYVEE
jgi:hypothetical protein